MRSLLLMFGCLLSQVGPPAESLAQAKKPFAIRVVDAATGRGVPLVEVKIVPDQFYMTDSNGYVVIDDPTLVDREVFVMAYSHGYEHEKDAFGYPGKAVKMTAGGEATLTMTRRNIAERLYRTTGIGIYRDSYLLKKPIPIKKPLNNANVTGLDSVQTAVVDDTIYWFWGDTDKLSYPLGNFATTGARSKLPGKGGLAPDKGVDIEYFENGKDFIQPMFENVSGLATWVQGTFSIAGPDGKQRVVTHAELRKGLGDVVTSKICVLNLQKPGFETLVELDAGARAWPRGQALHVTVDGQPYVYFATPYPIVRVPARWDAIIDPSQYEAYTPLKAGNALDPAAPALDRNPQGQLVIAWKKNTAPVNRDEFQKLVDDGHVKPEENPLTTVSAETGKPIILAAGSVHWNDYRQRYILLSMEAFGDPSFLGETWYAEAKRPEGPYEKAVKVVSHYKYSFYNICQHEYFDEKGGQLVYFEGTYTTLFTENVQATPWYDYNQVMYRLDLADERLRPAYAE